MRLSLSLSQATIRHAHATRQASQPLQSQRLSSLWIVRPVPLLPVPAGPLAKAPGAAKVPTNLQVQLGAGTWNLYRDQRNLTAECVRKACGPWGHV